MRFIIIVKASAASEAGALPEDSLADAMARYDEALAQAGVLLDANVLQPSSQGWRMRYSGGQRSLIDGPFAETRELVAGYTLIQVRSRDEAMEWSRRFPAPNGEGAEAEIEVRPLYELEDFKPGPAQARFRDRVPAKA